MMDQHIMFMTNLVMKLLGLCSYLRWPSSPIITLMGLYKRRNTQLLTGLNEGQLYNSVVDQISTNKDQEAYQLEGDCPAIN